MKFVRDESAPKRGGEGVVAYSELSIGGANEVSCKFNGEDRDGRDS